MRGGVQRTKTPTQDGQRDARVPDADRWTYAAGASYQVTPRIAVDAAAQYVDFENTTIDRATLVAGSIIRTNGALRDASAIVTSLGARVSF